jgi:D-threo-aldose 1-dehydrogenase
LLASPLDTRLPGLEGKATSRLGLGMATLMREGSRRRRQYVFDAAYECGFRHWDVAPLYGLGHAEEVLGKLLRRAAGDVTIASKFGLRPSSVARLAGRFQKPLRAILDRSAILKGLARSYVGSAVRPEAPAILDVLESLKSSVNELGVEKLDILLMHDMPWTDAWESLWGDLSAHVFDSNAPLLGISGTSDEDPDPLSLLTDRNVLQVTGSAFDVPGTRPTDAFEIYFGLFARELRPAMEYLSVNHDARRSVEALVGRPARSHSDVAALLASLNLAKSTDSILLIGTTQAAHAVSIWTGVEAMLPAVLDNRRAILQRLTPLQEALWGRSS